MSAVIKEQESGRIKIDKKITGREIAKPKPRANVADTTEQADKPAPVEDALASLAQETITLSAGDSEVFMSALNSPPEPSESLRKVARRHADKVLHENEPQVLDETLRRPEMLHSKTYKIKTPLFEHAVYVTISDIILNQNTEHEIERPFEIFINSKNMDHFQWIVALTRIMSAIFRKGGNIAFLVEELRSVFDPRGGYFKKGGKYKPSLVAEIGDVIAQHLEDLGLYDGGARIAHAAPAQVDDEPQRPGATCPDCGAAVVIKTGGCEQCTACQWSRCG